MNRNDLHTLTRTTSVLAITAFVGVTTFTTNMQWEENKPYPDITSQPERMVEKHGCWTDNAPEGVIPGHVVYAAPGTGPRFGGAHMTTLALEQIPTSMGGLGKDHGLTIYGFCA
jgi:hypothetical protein